MADTTNTPKKLANSIPEKYDMKPGLAFIDERTKQFRYADDTGSLQWTQPISRYRTLTEIKRGQAVSVATKEELYDYAYETSATQEPFSYSLSASDPEITKNSIITTKKTTYSNEKIPNIKYVLTIEETYNEKGEVVVSTRDDFYNNGIRFEFPLTVKANDNTYKDVYNFNKDTLTIFGIRYNYNEKEALEIIGDPESCVVPTNTKKHEKAIGIALDYSEGYGGYIHALSFGKFTFDTDYEGKNEDFFKGTTKTDVFDHTGKEYNPKFSYDDVGKKVYVRAPYKDNEGNEHLGELTIDETETYKNYHNIICIGLITDAPSNDTETKTTLEIAISGDQRGLVDSTQFEVTLGEDIVVSSLDPIRVLAVGQEEDTNFSARICFTPQKGTFSNTDFIAFQKMDGKTSIIYFGNDIDITGSSDKEDEAFLHMAQSYVDIYNYNKADSEKIQLNKVKFNLNDNLDATSINKNIADIQSVLDSAIRYISDVNLPENEAALTFKTVTATEDNLFGALDLTATFPGGYYTLYVSKSMQARLDGTVVTCGGSHYNKGKAVLADIRIPTRRSLIGIYYGSELDTVITKGSPTLALRLGEYDIPDVNNAFSTWDEGQDYYLGMNGRVVKFPYNQFDFVSKIGFVKSSADGDKRFLVDIGSATRHYNGDLPVGYMKPAVRIGTNYSAEYGFLLMDHKGNYSKAEYEALYTRLLGWFDESQLKADTGWEENYFKVPKVCRMVPEIIDGKDTGAQVEVPMQIKAISDGIYEEMPRIPFKRFFGKFDVESESDFIRAVVDPCEITDIVDYGICEDGYTLPTLDTLDIHLFVDPNENYDPNGDKPHDWHEIREGFFNYNNSVTYGYTWKINQHPASDAHPFGCYELLMDIGEGSGVAYVTDKNQSPLKMTGCYYKLYVARREVFTRQFDIEAIYRNYISNTIYTDETREEVVLNKAVSGKAVLDAIRNIDSISSLSATGDNAVVELGPLGKPVETLILNTKTDLPILSATTVYIGNSENIPSFEITGGKVYKRNYNGANFLEYKDGKYVIEDDELVSAKQLRVHATSTIDNKNYTDYIGKADNKTGLIHGMIFGRKGNIDVDSIWSLKPSLTSNRTITEESQKLDGYIPVTIRGNDGKYSSYIEGDIIHIPSDQTNEIAKESFNEVNNLQTFMTSVGDKSTSSINEGTFESGLETRSGTVKTTEVNNGIFINRIVKDTKGIQELYDLEKGSLQIRRYGGVGNAGADIYAGTFTTASLSKYKRIHGELIRDNSVLSTSLAEGSKQYDDDNNKLKTVLGSALQAAYELPLAYWQYNTEKEWSQDSLGIIIERVKDVAENINASGNNTFAHLDWNGNTATAKVSGEEGNKLSIQIFLDGDDKKIFIYNDGINVLGTTYDADHNEDIENSYTEDNYKDNKYIDFDINNWVNLSKTNLSGGETKTVSRNIVENLSSDSNYKENKFHYTNAEEISISNFLKTIIDNSGNGQNITSTVGMLLMAAKESQERLLKLEASTFGRDYETIPGGHPEYPINIPGVTSDPTNYGLNRLVRALCNELYLDTNPFDINGTSTSPTSSFSKIDHINQDIHGRMNDNNNTDFAPNELDSIDSTSYPYDDMINSPNNRGIRLGTSELSKEKKDEIISKGNGVASRVDMKLSNVDNEGNYISEAEGNTASENDKFNGIVDAIYRITTKLNALTVSVNNSDNIADEPVRLNTIRSNIATLLEEAYFNGAEITTKDENNNYVTKVNEENDYKDVSGKDNAPYNVGKNKSRLQALSEALYNYSLNLPQNITVLGLNENQKFGTENKYYTTREFNGKQLLIDKTPETSGLNGTTLKMAVPTNIENYNYASVIDIIIDAIGNDWVRKDNLKASAGASDAKTVIETRSAKTITKRLEDIEKCLDVIVSKISRQHNFEAEINNGIENNDIDGTADTTTHSSQKVYSIEKYLGFLNDYLGTSQSTTDKLDGNNPETNATITQVWEADKLNVEVNAENTIPSKKNIQAGLEDMLKRIQAEESLSRASGEMLGEDYDWSKVKEKKVNGQPVGEKDSPAKYYNLTEDIKDILLTIYGNDTESTTDGLGIINDNQITTKHRKMVNSNNNVNRFVEGEKNIIDAIVNEMYYLPQPGKLVNDSYTKTTSSNDANTDSRSAEFYDFDINQNVYDLLNEKAIGYGNRNEFFNDIGYFEDGEVLGKDGLHHRWSRFEVLENEIRNLRKLIGNNIPLTDDSGHLTDIIDLKFNGILKYSENKFNSVIDGNVTSNGIVEDSKDEGTSILKFLANVNTANNGFRQELGDKTDDRWAKVYYLNDYPDADTNNGQDITDNLTVKTSYSNSDSIDYNLYKDDNGKSIYERIYNLEKNAVQVDAILDSIKSPFRTKNGNINSNIQEIVNYLGNFEWITDKEGLKDSYYGSFGSLPDKLNTDSYSNVPMSINLENKNVTGLLNLYNNYLRNIYDVIGKDDAVNPNDFVSDDDTDSGDEIVERNVRKSETLWARLNAVESLNKNDVDITNILTVSESVPLNDKRTFNNSFIKTRALNTNDSLATDTDGMSNSDMLSPYVNQNAMIPSVGYVDNAINAATNNIINKTGYLNDDSFNSGVWDNGDRSEKGSYGAWINPLSIKDDYIYQVGEGANAYDDWGRTGKDIRESFTPIAGKTKEELTYVPYPSGKTLYFDTSKIVSFAELQDDVKYLIFNSEDTYNAEAARENDVFENSLLNRQTIYNTLIGINDYNDINRNNINSLYKHLNALYGLLDQDYDKGVNRNTTGSLLTWDGPLPTEDDIPTGYDDYDGDVTKYNWIDSSQLEKVKNLTSPITKSSLSNEEIANAKTWANFRKIPGANNVYRGASPIDNTKGRAEVAIKLIEMEGIKTVLNLADYTDYNIDFDSEIYYKNLNDNGYVIINYLPSDKDINGNEFKTALVGGLKKLIEVLGKADSKPLYIHCFEGKWRAGFVSCLFSLLCDASQEAVIEDYMESFKNYYNVTKTLTPTTYGNVKDSWVSTLNYVFNNQIDRNGAKDYLIKAGLTETEVTNLISLLRKQ